MRRIQGKLDNYACVLFPPARASNAEHSSYVRQAQPGTPVLLARRPRLRHREGDFLEDPKRFLKPTIAEAIVGFVLSGTNDFKIMKTKRITLLTRFEPETRFDVTPVHVVPFRGTCETALERFKTRLLRAALNTEPDADFYAPLRRAANEAAAVAWMTPFPLLFLPTLFDEKIAAARRQFARAQYVRVRSRKILAEIS
jgi:hypothetical protein